MTPADPKRPPQAGAAQGDGSLAPAQAFSPAERAAVYRAINTRRDVRDEFLDDEVPRDVVMRILDAAHHAPSVGFMQPWNSHSRARQGVRARVAEAFSAARAPRRSLLEPDRRAQYRNLKLEGILKAPLNICVTCDRDRHGATGLGRTQQPNTDLLSTACAVQNLWLAARVEGVGVGWVSILRESELRAILDVPKDIAVVAYLCVGYVDRAYARPELEVKQWARRLRTRRPRLRGSMGRARASTVGHNYVLRFLLYVPVLDKCTRRLNRLLRLPAVSSCHGVGLMRKAVAYRVRLAGTTMASASFEQVFDSAFPLADRTMLTVTEIPERVDAASETARTRHVARLRPSRPPDGNSPSDGALSVPGFEILACAGGGLRRRPGAALLF